MRAAAHGAYLLAASHWLPKEYRSFQGEDGDRKALLLWRQEQQAAKQVLSSPQFQQIANAAQLIMCLVFWSCRRYRSFKGEDGNRKALLLWRQEQQAAKQVWSCAVLFGPCPNYHHPSFCSWLDQ